MPIHMASEKVRPRYPNRCRANQKKPFKVSLERWVESPSPKLLTGMLPETAANWSVFLSHGQPQEAI